MADDRNDDLKKLGLGDVAFGTPHEPWNDESVAHGDAAKKYDLDELVRQGRDEGTHQFEGFRVSRYKDAPSVWKIISADSETEVSAAGSQEAVKVEEKGKVIHVDFARSGRVKIARRGTGDGILLEETNNRPQIVPFHSLPDWFHLELNSPIRDWISELDDPWLVASLEHKLELGTAWQEFVAVGALIRLRRHNPDDSARLAKALLRGESAELEEERQWARQLPDDTCKAMVIATLTAIESFGERVRDLETELNAGDVPLAREILHTLHLRDDVASAMLLLDRKRHMLKEAVEPSDARVSALGQELSDMYDLADDERLIRASVSDPAAWWTQLN